MWENRRVTTLSLVRHGQTDWNKQHRIQGSTDIPLNETGREQARLLAHELIDDEPWDGIYTSPLIRARETARIIATVLGLPEPTTESRIVERCFGEVEGLTDEERVGAYPIGSVVPGSESREALRERGVAAINAIADAHPAKRLIVVSHGGVLGQILRHITDDELPGPTDMIPNGVPTIVQRRDDGTWTVVAESILRGAREHAPIL